MAIWAYTGLPRHGKTYHAVKDQVLPALRAGRRVVTNIPLNEDAIRAIAGDGGVIVQLKNEDLAADPEGVLGRECTPGSVCLFDELWRFLPAGMVAKAAPAAWKTLFAEHGHRVDSAGVMMQVILVTQDLAQVAAFARALVERTVVVRKLTVIGAAKKYRVDVYAGGVTGTNPPVGRRISEEFGTYDKGVFACYVSRTMSEAGGNAAVNENVLDGRGTIWRHPYVRYGVPVAVVLGIWGVSRVVSFFSGGDSKPVQKVSDIVTAPGRGFLERAQPPTSQVVVSRIAGVLRGESDASSRVLLEDAGFMRWVGWHTARCRVRYDEVTVCDYEGKLYVFDVDMAVRKPPVARAGIGQVFGLPADGAGSR